jgi:hypothetical protein
MEGTLVAEGRVGNAVALSQKDSGAAFDGDSLSTVGGDRPQQA